MVRSMKKWAFLVGMVAVFVAGTAPPAQAEFTKLYRFTNDTGVDQSSVSAITHGFEYLSSTYAYPYGWLPAITGYTLISGVYCTTITFGGDPVGDYATVLVGWRTWDYSCRLRDLRWGDGQAVLPTLLVGVPGGGMVIYDHPNPGDLTVVVTNDNLDPEQCLTFPDAEWAIAASELSLLQLGALDGAGLVELRVDAIVRDIGVLRDEIEYYTTTGELPSPAGNSLARRMDRAIALLYDGLATYLDGDLERALFLWGKADQQIRNFIAEVTNMSDGNLSQELYDRWIVDGDGEIATAPEIRDAIDALPDGQALQDLSPLPAGLLPVLPGLDPGDYLEWPVAELCPGEWTAFVFHKVREDEGLVLHGSVVDAAGNVLLDWLEQATATPAPLDIEPPVITASATPDELWPPDHTMIKVTLDVTVSDDSLTVWYVADVESNQPELGTGDGDTAPDWWRDPDDDRCLWLRAERSGNHPTEVREYTITIMAMDMAGNLSTYYLVVPVDHDESS